jgi:hypothetical protein
MKIALIKIHNILGIADCEVAPQQFNEITGSNGVNKTNFLNAIKSVFEGGHDATLLRNGAKKGEVVLILDDGVDIRKTVTEKGSTVQVKKGETVMKRPMETIQSLADLFSVNPIAFLGAPKADRARVMLESMPIVLDTVKLTALSGMDLPAFHPGMHATTAIDTVRKMVYDARTGTNRVLTEKRSTIEQLRQAMPAAPADENGAAIEGSEAELQVALEEINRAEEGELADLEAKVEAYVGTANQTEADAKQEYEAALAALRQQIETLTAEHNVVIQGIADSKAKAKERRVSRREGIKTAHAAARQPIISQLSVMRASRDSVARREQTLETIRTLTEAADLLDAESAERTSAIEAIDAYKTELLSALPIPNIEVVNGEIVRNGVPFDRLNQAQRTEIAIDLAKLRAGKLGVVCVDGIEHMDPDTFEQFQAKAIESGLQFFVSRVGRGPFSINGQAGDKPF